jgi:hypothetical protein
MALWDLDLTTEDGAIGAAQAGGLAAFIAGLLTGLTLVTTADLMRTGAVTPLFGLITLIQAALYIVAGLRLRAGKGLVWGSIAALLLGLTLAGNLISVAIGGIIINGILIVVLVNGLRGAWALRAGKFDAEATAEIFS